jgi:hypothetical protein
MTFDETAITQSYTDTQYQQSLWISQYITNIITYTLQLTSVAHSMHDDLHLPRSENRSGSGNMTMQRHLTWLGLYNVQDSLGHSPISWPSTPTQSQPTQSRINA